MKDINKLLNFGKLIHKSNTNRIVEGILGQPKLTIATSNIGDNGVKFAIKILNTEDSKNSRFDVIQNEVETLYQLDHPNIVKFYHAYSDNVNTYIVMERCNDEIYDVIPEDRARILATKLFSALAYLHARKICHLDIKPANIMIKTADSNDLRLIDFGYAYNVTSPFEFIPRGTPEYYAPEVADKLVGTFSDMWSCGITLYYWLTGVNPFKGMKIEEIVTKVLLGKVDFETGMYF